MKKFLHRLPVIIVGVLTLIAFAACDSADVLTGIAADPSASVAGPSLATTADIRNIGVNVLLNTALTDEIRREVGRIGKITDELLSINAFTVRGRGSIIADLSALPYVESATPDAERYAPPMNAVAVADILLYGISTWDLDAVNVTDTEWFYPTEVDPDTQEIPPPKPVATGRVEPYSGAGVFVAVLDTGLVKNWRSYFPEERIAAEYAMAFGGGGGEVGTV
ncbi:MAG: hypothetical protein KAU31_11915, partial [Spirochaetaceae bacterium]|nr:hypothetical protein [Spirochaetaceae bacterium]